MLLNLALLPAIAPMDSIHITTAAKSHLWFVAGIASAAFGPAAGTLLAALIIWTAFASIFSLLLGYSRVPYAAAEDGNYFRALGKLHPVLHIPHRSLIALGLIAAFFCLFPLSTVITLLVVTRILLQFIPQQIGVIYLRWKRPELTRPYKMPLFPLPPLIALGGFLFLLSARVHAAQALLVTSAIALSGTLLFLLRDKGLGQWPFHGRRNNL
jgi:amino acid transporter